MRVKFYILRIKYKLEKYLKAIKDFAQFYAIIYH